MQSRVKVAWGFNARLTTQCKHNHQKPTQEDPVPQVLTGSTEAMPVVPKDESTEQKKPKLCRCICGLDLVEPLLLLALPPTFEHLNVITNFTEKPNTNFTVAQM